MEIGIFVLGLHKLLWQSLTYRIRPLSLSGGPLVLVTLVDLVVSCGDEEKTACKFWWFEGGAHKRDIMLTGVCGGGTYMCLQFSVYLWGRLPAFRASLHGMYWSLRLQVCGIVSTLTIGRIVTFCILHIY